LQCSESASGRVDRHAAHAGRTRIPAPGDRIVNEDDARRVLLVRAMETADPEGRLLSLQQRQDASDVVRASMPGPGRSLTHRSWSERFLIKRAERLYQDAAARRPAIQTLASPSPVWPLVRGAVVLAGFVGGLASDALANPGRINLLSAPLFGIVAWNWAMALIWTVLKLAGLLRPASGHAWLAGLAALPARWRRNGFAVATAFSRSWFESAAPLMRARVTGTLHLSAAVMALGLMAYMAAKALPNEFSVGWESQLLKTPGAVHAVLQVIFLPVSLLSGVTGIEPFSLNEIASMHHWQGTHPELADRWLQLVVTLLLVSVVVPRLVLWLVQSARARRLRRHFPLDLTAPYFAALLASGSGLRHRLAVWPYSTSIDSARAGGLERQAVAMLGANTTVSLHPATPYGVRPDTLAAQRQGIADGEVPLTAALFPLSATPESETHGVFLARLKDVAGDAALVILDSSGFIGKLGQGVSGTERLNERRALWEEFARQRGVTRVLVMNLGG
jgi:hypothetical protein